MIKRGVWVCNCSREAHWKRREKSGAVVLLMSTFQDVLIFLQIGKLTLYFAACAQVFTIFFFPAKLDVTVAGGWCALTSVAQSASLVVLIFSRVCSSPGGCTGRVGMEASAR